MQILAFLTVRNVKISATDINGSRTVAFKSMEPKNNKNLDNITKDF